MSAPNATSGTLLTLIKSQLEGIILDIPEYGELDVKVMFRQGKPHQLLTTIRYSQLIESSYPQKGGI